MKKKDKYKLINYAIKEYGDMFNHNYQHGDLSTKYLKDLLKQYKHSYMAEWNYCCRGLYNCCWQELFFEGNWYMSQTDVNKAIEYTIDITAKDRRRDKRLAWCQDSDGIHVVIITRDLPHHRRDYFITLTNKEI